MSTPLDTLILLLLIVWPGILWLLALRLVILLWVWLAVAVAWVIRAIAVIARKRRSTTR